MRLNVLDCTELPIDMMAIVIILYMHTYCLVLGFRSMSGRVRETSIYYYDCISSICFLRLFANQFLQKGFQDFEQ